MPGREVRVESDEIKRLKRAALAREAASAEWQIAIRAAHAAGVSTRVIGEAAGVSHTRVLQIVRGQ